MDLLQKKKSSVLEIIHRGTRGANRRFAPIPSTIIEQRPKQYSREKPGAPPCGRQCVDTASKPTAAHPCFHRPSHSLLGLKDAISVAAKFKQLPDALNTGRQLIPSFSRFKLHSTLRHHARLT